MMTSRLLQRLRTLRPPSRMQVAMDWDRCLPIEILEQIFDCILDERDNCGTRVAYIRATLQPTLRAAALVCQVWYDIVTKYLYNEIYVASSKAVDILCNTLSKYKRLRPLVHQFYFTNKVYATGDAQILVTAIDIYNIRKINGLCPSLNMLTRATSWTKLAGNDELAFRTLKLDQSRIDRLTHLEIAVPNAAFFGDSMIFSSSVEFPALQELFITSSWSTYHGRPAHQTPQWFRMPQLRRLSLLDLSVRRGQKLTFPEHSPLINTIELLRGDYEMVNNLFDPNTSPLLPYSRTLESLTITTNELGENVAPIKFRWKNERIDYGCDRQTVWYLGFLKNLVELCVPFRSFAKIRIASYPPLLKDLVLVGYIWDHYAEPSNIILDGQDNISEVLFSMLSGWGPQGLKRVRVLVNNVESWTKEYDLPGKAREAGVDLQRGLGTLYGYGDLGCELIEIGMKKMSLR